MILARFKNLIIRNKKLIIITFELFWVVLFILSNFLMNRTSEIPQFVYVNF